MYQKYSLKLGVILVLVIVPSVIFALDADFFNSPTLNIIDNSDFNPDRDYDGFIGTRDICRDTPFNMYVINQYTRRNPAVLSFTDPNGASRPDYDSMNPPQIYLRLKQVRLRDKKIILQTSMAQDFSSPVTSYTLAPDAIVEIPEIQKIVNIRYVNSTKQYAVIIFTDSEGTQPGCGGPTDSPSS